MAERADRLSAKGLRVFWPRQARRNWKVSELPVRLAGMLPWVLRVHLVVWVLFGVGGVLFAAAPLVASEVPDWQAGVLMVLSGLLMVTFSIGGIVHLRRSTSAVVTHDGILVDRPSSGLWFRSVVPHGVPGGDRQTITAVELVVLDVDYELIGGGLGISITARRLALSVQGCEVPSTPGLTFPVRQAGRKRAETAGTFLAQCFGAPFIDRSAEASGRLAIPAHGSEPWS